MCICLWPEFDCPEVTLCGWQDIKFQLLLLLLPSFCLSTHYPPTPPPPPPPPPPHPLHFSVSLRMQIPDFKYDCMVVVVVVVVWKESVYEFNFLFSLACLQEWWPHPHQLPRHVPASAKQRLLRGGFRWEMIISVHSRILFPPPCLFFNQYKFCYYSYFVTLIWPHWLTGHKTPITYLLTYLCFVWVWFFFWGGGWRWAV